MSPHRMHYVSFVALLISLRILRSLTQSVIEIPDGKIVGVTDHWVTSFLGIRYAQRPVRARRLAPPVPVPSWKGTLRADNYGAVCFQVPDNVLRKYLTNVKQSEDCLNLNIFIPRDENRVKLPVLVFVHPGQFQSGAAAMVNGSLLAMETGSIVVTFNYRLGVFGFAFYRSILSGNYGLLDQILAIKWVKSNIAAFGGDQDNIAILADTVNAGLLRYSRQLNGTFSKIVSLPLDIPYTFLSKSEVNPIENIMDTLCNGTVSMECIHGLSPRNLLNMTAEQSPWDLPLFRPRQDDDIINDEERSSDTQINKHIEQLHLNVVAPSYIYRKTSVVIQHQHYQCTPQILENVIRLISTMTSSNVKTLLETFYYPDDITANSICREVLRLVYDFASVSSVTEVNRASRSALVFLALLERYFVIQGGTSDPLCIFRGGGEGCDSDETSALVLSAVKHFLKHSYPSSDRQWRPYTQQSRNHVIFNGYSTSAADKSRWPLVRQEKLWHDLAPALRRKGLNHASHDSTCLAARTEWGMSEEQLEILLYSLVFISLFLTFVSMTLVRILCSVNKPTKKAQPRGREQRTAAPYEGGHYNGACHGEVEDSQF